MDLLLFDAIHKCPATVSQLSKITDDCIRRWKRRVGIFPGFAKQLSEGISYSCTVSHKFYDNTAQYKESIKLLTNSNSVVFSLKKLIHFPT